MWITIITYAGDGNVAGIDLPDARILQHFLGKQRLRDVKNAVAAAANEVRVRRCVEIEPLLPVYRAERTDDTLLPEHGKIAVHRSKRQVGDVRL